MVQALGARYINLKSVHLPFELSPAELAAARQGIEAAGLVIVGGGVITFEHDTDADVEKYFAYAKGAGMPLITVHAARSEEHTSELQSQSNLVCRLLLEKKKYQ